MSTLRPQVTKNSKSWVPDFQVEPTDNLITCLEKKAIFVFLSIVAIFNNSAFLLCHIRLKISVNTSNMCLLKTLFYTFCMDVSYFMKQMNS